MTTPGRALTASDPEPPPGDHCSECGDPMKPGYRYSRCCMALVVSDGDDDTMPADGPTPDWWFPPEKCPHCDAHPNANRVDEHITAEHADLSPCTARYFDGGCALYLCAFRVGHTDGQYGDWHASVSGTMGRVVWNDTHAGAQPHREEATP